MRKYHTEGQRYIGSIRVYGNRGEDTVKGFGELFPCLVLTKREEPGLPSDDLAVYFAHCYRVMRLEMVQKLFDAAATERSGACDVAGSMSAVSGTVKALCGAGVAIAVSVAAVISEQFLQLKFLVQSFAAARPLHFTCNYIFHVK